MVSEDFPEGSANFVSYINNAKSAGAGVIFAPVSTNYAQLIIEAAGAQGFEGSLLGSDTWDNNMVVESTVGKNVSVEVTTFYQEGRQRRLRRGHQGVDERHPRRPDQQRRQRPWSPPSPPWATTPTSPPWRR